MIGLGRMGANMVRRLMRGGHTCVVYDRLGGRRRRRWPRKARPARRRSPSSSSKLAKPRARLPDGAGGLRRRDRSTSSCRCSSADDIIIDGGNSHYHDDIARAKRLQPKGIHYVDMGTSGGVWGLERGYCLMIGGETRRREAARSDLRDAGARPRRHPANAGPREAGRHRRARLPALRSDRRRPLREDGPQRHRVRPDGRLRRGPQHPEERQHRQAHAREGRGDDAAAESRALPVRLQPRRHHRAVAARQRHHLLAARPDRAGARGRSRTSTSSAARCPTPARGAGRWRRPTTRACPRTC